MRKYLLFGMFFLTGFWFTNAQYCEGGPTSTFDSNVEAVSIVGDNGTEIDHIGCPGVLGVEDLTAQSVDLLAGQTYTIDITFGTCGGNFGGVGEFWIDFNQDEIFDTASESLGTSSGTPGNAPWNDVVSFTFTVPLIAEAGVTRMRVMQWEGGTLPLDSCGEPIWGSVMDFSVNIEAPVFDCQFPTAIVADVLSDTEVELSWDGGGETEWNVEYGVVGFDPGAGEELGSFNNVTATTLLVDNLSANTAYQFSIQAVCTDENSFWNSVNATTDCGIEIAPFFESFDGGSWASGGGFNNAGDQFDPCWDRNAAPPAYAWGTRAGTTSSNFATGPAGDFSGSGNYVFVESSNGVNGDEAIFNTPLIDVTALTTPALSFYYHMRGADIGTLTVEAKEQDDTDWTEVFTLTGQQQTVISDPWEQAIVSLTGFEQQTIQVRFRTSKLGFNGDVSLDEVRVLESPTCFNVQDLSNDSASFDSATFSWTDYPDAIDGFLWEVYLSGTVIEDNDPLFEGTVAGGETSVTVTGLDADTNYILVLISDCGDVNGLGFQNSSVEFSTTCDVFSAPFAEDFDGDDWVSGTAFNNAGDQVNQCWSRTPAGSPAYFWGTRTGTTGSTFSTGPASDFSGTGKYVYVESSNGVAGDEAIFTSPLIDLTALTDPATTFYYHMRGANIDVLTVEAKEVGTSDWTEVFSITGQQQLLAADPWEQAIVSLDGFEQQIIQVRFRTSKLGFNGDVAIDNFTVGEAPSCFNVTGFSIVPAVTTADATWDEIPSAIDGYILEVYNGGEEVGVDTPFVSEDIAQDVTNFEITGLSEGQTYIATITSNCGVDDLSDTIEITFSTVSFGDTCEAAIVVDSLPYTTTDDTANYSDFYNGAPGANCGATAPYLGGNDVVYSFTPDEDMVVLVTMDPTNTWSGIFVYDSCDAIGTNCLNGTGSFDSEIREFEVLLDADQEYIFVISTWPAPQTTGYTFELTQVLCGSVGGLQTTLVSSDQIDYAWNAVPGAIGYNWALFNSGDDPENDTPVDSGSTTDTFLSIDNLSSSTAYDFYILSECDDDAFGNQTGPFTIVTECAPENYPTPVEDFADANFDYNSNPLMSCWLEGTGALTASMSVVEGFTGWGAGNFNNTAGTENGQAASINLFGTGTSWLVSQQIDLGDGTDDLVVEYDVAITPFGFGNNGPVTTIGQHTLSVVVSTDGGNTWSDADVLKVFDNTNIPGAPQTDILSLDGYTGIVKIGFYANRIASADVNFYLDNFRVIIAPTCFAPSNLDAQIVGLEDVEFTWDTNASNDVENQWEVQYGLEGFELDSADAESVIVDDNPIVTVSGLASASDYEFYVRAICGPGDASEWTGPEQFRSPIVPIEIGAGGFHNEVYCYGNFDFQEWLFVSTADEELEMIFNTGSIEDAIGSNDVLQIYDGFNENGILLYDSTVDDSVLAGLTFTSTSGGFYMILTTDLVQSCEGGQGELPEIFDFDVLSETFSTPGFGNDEFSYYPNPVETNLNIQSANLVEAYELYSMSGQRLMSNRPNTNTPSINMQDLSTGVYLMKVTINGISETFQVIKK